jgi:DNA-binding transcriptional LysR family regulator
MRYINISRADLNLLVSFQVLMEERSVTAAANRMFLSQPAMSRVLDRLRHLFQDPLLLRTGRGYSATRRALHIYNELEKLLPGIETVIGGDQFNPAQSTDHFRIAMTDNVALSLLPKVMDRVMRLSSSITVEVLAWKEDAFQKLTTNALDLVIWINSAPYPLKSETIYYDEFVCLVRTGHPIGKRRMTVKKYLTMQHVVVSLGGLMQGRLDDALNRLGYNRTARLSVPFFGALASVVERTDLIATLPGRLAKDITRRSKTRIIPFPIKLPKIAYIQVWHPRNDENVAHQWLRELVKQSVGDHTN